MNCRLATIGDIAKLKELWYESFLEHDSKASIDYYFENNFDLEYTFILEENNEIISSLQLNQHQLVIDNSIEDVSFVIGVATFKKYQRKGYMKILLEYAISYAKNILKQKYMILQAYNWDIYRPFGFVDCYYKSKVILNFDELNNIEAIKVEEKNILTLLTIYQEYTKNLNGYKLRDKGYFRKYLDMLDVEQIKHSHTDEAYAVYTIEENIIKVDECAYFNISSLMVLLKSIMLENNCTVLELHTDIYTKVNSSAVKELFMMVKNLGVEKLETKEGLYISEDI